MWRWARGTPQYLEFPFNIFATVEVSDFKIGKPLEFAEAHHKNYTQKVCFALLQGSSLNFGGFL